MPSRGSPGPGDRLAEADERHQQFFREYPDKNDRDWLIAAFDHLAATNETVAGLFDRDHNPLWEMEPSYEQAAELLKFWRRLDADGRIVHDFTDKEDLDTRFLGDLYQDLSDHAKKTYALLQTPSSSRNSSSTSPSNRPSRNSDSNRPGSTSPPDGQATSPWFMASAPSTRPAAPATSS